MSGTRLEIDYSVIAELGRKLYSNNPMFVVPRELLQNSLDAGSTEIEVNWTQSGDLLLQVLDNGSGIEDFQKHFLTIGGSNKRNKEGSIGGFGIAKLSIFSCKDWTVESNAYRITRNILFNNEEMVTIRQRLGTSVEVVFDESDITYQSTTLITGILETCTAPCKLWANGNQVVRREEVSVVLPSGKQITKLDKSLFGGYLLVRVNGLLMFRKSLYGNTDHVIDFTLSGDPYSNDYPLSANREDFISDTYESQLVKLVVEELNALESQKREAEERQINKIEYFNGILCNHVQHIDTDDSTIVLLAKASRVVKQICKLVNFTEPVELGFTGDYKVHGSYMMGSINIYNKHLIFINASSPEIQSVSGLLAVLVHECVHMIYQIEGHYEDFSSRITILFSTIIGAIIDGKMKL